MKVTFWLSRNNSNMQEFSVLRVWGEYKILWSDGFQYNERYLTLGVKLRHPPMQSLCLRPPQTHTLLLCSPELPDSWLFSIYSVPQGCPAEGVLMSLYQQSCDSTGSSLVAKYICIIYMQNVQGCTCPQGEEFFLDSDQHQAEDFPESSSSIFPQTDFRCCPWSSLPSCPACLGLWPLSASVSISGTLSWDFLAQSLQPLLCWLEQLPRDSQAGVELGINSMLLESHWNVHPAAASFPLLEDLPEPKHPAGAVAETLGAPSEMHPLIFGPVKEGPLWEWLSSAPRVAPAWSPLFWSECEAKLCSYFLE